MTNCLVNIESNHAVATLQRVIREGVAALRVTVEDLRRTPDRLLMTTAKMQADVLSSAVAQLARQVDLSTLDASEKGERTAPTMDVDAVSGLLDRMGAMAESGCCDTCGGALPPVHDSTNETDDFT